MISCISRFTVLCTAGLALLLLFWVGGSAGAEEIPSATQQQGPNKTGSVPQPERREDNSGGRPTVPAPILLGPAIEEVRPPRGIVSRLLAELDSDEYAVRQRAAEKLRQMSGRPEWSVMLAEEFQKVLVSPGVSFEVRRCLEPLRRALPQAVCPIPQAVSADEIEGLVRQLEDDAFSKRLAASKRLEWLLGRSNLVCPIFCRLKARMSSRALPADARQWLEPIYRKAREAWLTSDPADWKLPPVSDAEIARWCDDLAGSQDPSRRADGNAFREIRDLLARDEYIPKAKQALEALQTRAGLSPGTAKRVEDLLELTRPVMLAECWTRLNLSMSSRLIGAQYLIVGVPVLGPGADRPSYFDRVSDRVAHCVSGQNLSPGDYPVGVAIPHPKVAGSMFHLVNLTSPRRQMAYVSQWQLDDTKPLSDLTRQDLQGRRFLRSQAAEARNLVELSHRTFAWLLARKQPLSLQEIQMLRQLDAVELSRFAGPLFSTIEDRPTPAGVLDAHPGISLQAAGDPFGGPMERGQPSRHALICELLAVEGTAEAADGLLRALESNRFLPVTAQSPYRTPWIAALAIANRDPWPNVDVWLAGLVARSEHLIEYRTEGPELGATAAAILLARHEQSAGQFGLRAIPDAFCSSAGLTVYRFDSSDMRAKVQAWWADRKK